MQGALNFAAPPNLAREQRAARAGADAAATARRQLFALACSIAERLASQHGTVCADDVQARLAELGHTSRALGNAAGMMFADRDKWEFVSYTKSARAGSHGNLIRVWRLK